jgi:hypothetical protein
MVQRHFWQELVEENWRERSVVWLACVVWVRPTFVRVSRTSSISIVNCRARGAWWDGQAFLEGLGKRRVLLDEVVIRPFSTRRPTEIVSAPKVYGFDTGFVAYYRGWQDLRREDLGVLWEHFVLNEIMARQQSREVSYWRDKRGHEVDFVLTGQRNKPIAVECKWSAVEFDTANLRIFRRQYSEGENFVLAQDVDRPFSRRFG